MVDTLLHFGEGEPNKFITENIFLENSSIGLHVIAFIENGPIAKAGLRAVFGHNLVKKLRNRLRVAGKIVLRLFDSSPRTVRIRLVKRLSTWLSCQI